MKYPMFGLLSLIAVACMATANADSASEDEKEGKKTETVWTVELKGVSG